MKLRGDTAKAPGGIRADKAQSYESIEQKATYVRNVLAPGLPVDEALPSAQLFDALDKMTISTPHGDVQLEPAVKNLPPGVEGWTEYDRERNRIIVALDETTTYAGLEKGSRRARFCLCHEVGHAVLHFCELMRTGAITHQMAALRRGGTLPHKKYMDTEWQANALSAALLMPAAGLALVESEVRVRRVVPRHPPVRRLGGGGDVPPREVPREEERAAQPLSPNLPANKEVYHPEEPEARTVQNTCSRKTSRPNRCANTSEAPKKRSTAITRPSSAEETSHKHL